MKNILVMTGVALSVALASATTALARGPKELPPQAVKALERAKIITPRDTQRGARPETTRPTDSVRTQQNATAAGAAGSNEIVEMAYDVEAKRLEAANAATTTCVDAKYDNLDGSQISELIMAQEAGLLDEKDCFADMDDPEANKNGIEIVKTGREVGQELLKTNYRNNSSVKKIYQMASNFRRTVMQAMHKTYAAVTGFCTSKAECASEMVQATREDFKKVVCTNRCIPARAELCAVY